MSLEGWMKCDSFASIKDWCSSWNVFFSEGLPSCWICAIICLIFPQQISSTQVDTPHKAPAWSWIHSDLVGILFFFQLLIQRIEYFFLDAPCTRLLWLKVGGSQPLLSKHDDYYTCSFRSILEFDWFLWIGCFFQTHMFVSISLWYRHMSLQMWVDEEHQWSYKWRMFVLYVKKVWISKLGVCNVPSFGKVADPGFPQKSSVNRSATGPS